MLALTARRLASPNPRGSKRAQESKPEQNSWRQGRRPPRHRTVSLTALAQSKQESDSLPCPADPRPTMGRDWLKAKRWLPPLAAVAISSARGEVRYRCFPCARKESRERKSEGKTSRRASR